MNEKHLYSFECDCGRMGALYGLFIATESEVTDAVGKNAYFGEVLGKHSEVYGTIEESYITKIEVSPLTLKELEDKFGDTLSGYNPLEYLSGEDE
ncbi:hypothetical protein [Neobacillus niacini]|uniref:hypothetical protein n=1 Tax=Neobacillus niacini TaxID=86668 RepID=UPI00286293D3|nr:hypothetical protein [Neobacillus niacini]MDR7001605.1 hypothetical protein [Neobacillus niacini]